MTTEYLDAIENAHIAELKKQRDALLKKVSLLSTIVRRVPSIIVSARLDARDGKPTKYDYTGHSKALNAPEY